MRIEYNCKVCGQPKWFHAEDQVPNYRPDPEWFDRLNSSLTCDRCISYKRAVTGTEEKIAKLCQLDMEAREMRQPANQDRQRISNLTEAIEHAVKRLISLHCRYQQNGMKIDSRPYSDAITANPAANRQTRRKIEAACNSDQSVMI